MTSWAYIAGYFDGEGTVNHYATSAGGMTRSLYWYNTHRVSLDVMREFMGVGKVIERSNFSGYRAVGGGGKLPAFALIISDKAGMVLALDAMIPHLIIKRDRAITLRAMLESVRSSPQNGVVARTPTEHLVAWYWAGNESHAEIAKRLGVTPSAVNAEFKKRGIASRPAGASHMHGKPKSEATRARMRAAQRKRHTSTLTEGNA